MSGGLGERGREVKGYSRGGKNVQGHVSSHTSCLDSVNYPAEGYYVFIWERSNKTDFLISGQKVVR